MFKSQHLTSAKKFTFAIIFFLCFFTQIKAQFYLPLSHPELEWQTFKTEHFHFYFHQGTKRTALLSAKILEEIYSPVTELYNYQPKDKIHVVFKDADDYANGGAYFFDDKMEIWASNLDFVMRGTKNWLRDVLTHEFIHMVSIQKAIKTSKKFPYGFFQWFGYEKERRKDVVRGFPNILVSYPLSSINIPVWYAEGIAQYQSNKARFDYRDPHREMVIRDRILNEQLLTYNQMTVFGKTSHGNESSYNLGFSFAKYLAERFGEEVLEKISGYSSEWSNYTFSAAIEKATHVEVDTLYAQWKDSLTHVYLSRTQTIRDNEQKGKAIELKGFGNFYPVYSPDGNKIAYLSNKGEERFFANELIIFNKKSNKKVVIENNIESSFSWSPDGSKIAYAKKSATENGSVFSDLYIYDLKDKERYRLTYNLRGAHPDFNREGNKLAFVSTTNGLHQLNILHLPKNLAAERSAVCAFDVESGKFYQEYADTNSQRRVEYIPGKIEQLIAFEDGRQIYHPRWSNDESKLVFGTSVAYGRNIGQYDFNTNSFSLLLEAKEELRYPVFQPQSDWLYYSASTTGIYNLYRYNLISGDKELITNVSGGAFMPSVSSNGDVVYACYDSIGYKIYEIEHPLKLDSTLANYDENYISQIPDKNFDDAKFSEYSYSPYKNTIPHTSFLPRLFVDYETIKPGLYTISSDVLDKSVLITGAAINSDFDYDLYGSFMYRDFPSTFLNKYSPALMAEVYNLNANVIDKFQTLPGEIIGGVYNVKREINFNLLLFAAGLNFSFFENSYLQLYYERHLYSAKILPTIAKTDDGLETYDFQFSFRYDYLRGQSYHLKVIHDAIKNDRFKAVNPSGGYYLFFKYSYQDNDFLDDFDFSGETDKIAAEVFKNYSYNTIDFSGEYYFKNPFLESHALGLALKASYIDRKVDSFFNNFAGGIIGLRGYPFFSIEGRHKLIGSVTYRFPIHQDIDYKIGHFHFDKLYFGTFYEYGNAFNREIKFNRFKRDVGLELRLDSFSYNMFPTKVFLQAVWPIDEITTYDDSRERFINYPQEWRYYFGVLFEFDLRDRISSLLDLQNFNTIKIRP